MSPAELLNQARGVRVLATDYDRTLTDEELRPVPEAHDALRRAREAGLKIVVISGRHLPFLAERVGDHSDAIVAENGCILSTPDGVVRAGEGEWDLRKLLAPTGVDVTFGDVIADFDVEHETLVRETLAEARVGCDLIRNRDRVMILPPGVDKAAGLLRALQALGELPDHAAVAGDGENDLPLFRVAGYGVAVMNALPTVKVHADYVTSKPGGHGIAEWVDRVWLPAVNGAREDA